MRFLEALKALAKLLHKLSETTGLPQLDDIAYALAVFLLLCLGGIYILGIFLYGVEKLQRPRPVKAPRGLTLLRLSSPVEPGDRPLRSVNQTFRAHSIAITKGGKKPTSTPRNNSGVFIVTPEGVIFPKGYSNIEQTHLLSLEHLLDGARSRRRSEFLLPHCCWPHCSGSCCCWRHSS